MNDTAPVLVTRADDVLRVTVNRPEKHNALSRAVLAALHGVFTGQREDETLRVAVLQGAGERSFAAGGDLRDLSAVRSHEDTVRMAEDGKRALDAIRAFPVPVVAALNGDALGGGSELALACDLRVFAAHARLGFVQGRLNISTAWGGGIDVLRLLGPARGLALLCRSELLPAAEAQALGLADAVAQDAQPLEEALGAFLEPLCRQAPQVLRAFKAVAHGVRMGLPRERLDELETRMFAATWTHEAHWAAAERILSRRG